jgi:hypothetical protein
MVSDGVRPEGHQKTYSYSYGNNTKYASSPGAGSTASLKNGQSEALRGSRLRTDTSSHGSVQNDPYGNTSKKGMGTSRYF